MQYEEVLSSTDYMKSNPSIKCALMMLDLFVKLVPLLKAYVLHSFINLFIHSHQRPSAFYAVMFLCLLKNSLNWLHHSTESLRRGISTFHLGCLQKGRIALNLNWKLMRIARKQWNCKDRCNILFTAQSVGSSTPPGYA